MAKKKLIKDMTRRGRLTHEHRINPNSTTWRKKALALWSQIVQRDGCCAICGKTRDQVKLDAHHLLPKERMQWFMFAPINGICLCYEHHKSGRHAVHRNPIFFAAWLQKNRPAQYTWCLARLDVPARQPPEFKHAYERLKVIVRQYNLPVDAA